MSDQSKPTPVPPEPNSAAPLKSSPGQPAAPFDAAKYVTQAAQRQAQATVEARAKEEAAMAEDRAKFEPMVGKTYSSVSPSENAFFKIIAFQVRVNLGVGLSKPAYLIERNNPHSSWWVACDSFLKMHQEAQLPQVIAKRVI